MIKISIIIPVFKTEQYIEHCLSSILPFLQRNDIECIFINDGTPDNAIEIVKTFTAEYRNVSIVNQPNKGLSAARNNGIVHSKGEYIFFLDSDDWIEGDIAALYSYSMFNNLDILAFNYKRYFENTGQFAYVPKNIASRIFSGPEFFYFIQREKLFMELAPLYLYKRDFLISNELFFTENIKHEDNEFTPRAILLSNRIAYLEEPIYIYRKRENSITTTIDSKRLYDLLVITESLEKFHSKYRDKDKMISKGIAIYGVSFIRKILYLHALLKNSGYLLDNVKDLVQGSKFFKWAVSQCDVFRFKLEGFIILHFYNVCLFLYQVYIKIRDNYVKYTNRSNWEK